MSICRPGVESGISTCLTSSQVLPVQLVYRVARGADGFCSRNTPSRNSAALGRTEGRRWGSVTDLFKSKGGLDGVWGW